mgnify:CR=1 FL=1
MALKISGKLVRKSKVYRFEQLIKSQFIKEESCNSVEDVTGVDDNHEDEPEPHGQVHLLIDDILKETLMLQSSKVTAKENYEEGETVSDILEWKCHFLFSAINN